MPRVCLNHARAASISSSLRLHGSHLKEKVQSQGLIIPFDFVSPAATHGSPNRVVTARRCRKDGAHRQKTLFFFFSLQTSKLLPLKTNIPRLYKMRICLPNKKSTFYFYFKTKQSEVFFQTSVYVRSQKNREKH